MRILECCIEKKRKEKKGWNSGETKSFYLQKKNSVYTLLEVAFFPLCDKELMCKLIDGNAFAE